MILATHGIIGSGSAFDIDALLFFNRVTSAGGSLSLIERQKQPLLLCDSRVIWVIGYRTDERFSVDSETKKILKAEIIHIK